MVPDPQTLSRALWIRQILQINVMTGINMDVFRTLRPRQRANLNDHTQNRQTQHLDISRRVAMSGTGVRC